MIENRDIQGDELQGNCKKNYNPGGEKLIRNMRIFDEMRDDSAISALIRVVISTFALTKLSSQAIF